MNVTSSTLIGFIFIFLKKKKLIKGKIEKKNSNNFPI